MKYKFLLALALCFSLFTSCNKGKTNPPFSPIGQDEIPDNEIWYTTTDGKEVFPLVTDGFGANYISTTYREDKGIMLFDAAVTDIPAGAFAYSDPLETMTLPKTVKTIGDYAFDQCRGLKDINLDEGIETIGKHAFCSCKKLTGTMSFSKELKKIEADAFKDVYFPTVSFHSDKVPSLDDSAFDEEAFFAIYVPSDKYDDYKANLGHYAGYILHNQTVTKDNTKDWMSFLPDAMPLHMVTIPGSHDCCTYNLFSAFNAYDSGLLQELGLLSDDFLVPFAQVQVADCADQFDKGIRYFDMRTAISPTYDIGPIHCDVYENPNGTVEIHHGYGDLFSVNGDVIYTSDYLTQIFQIYISHTSYQDAVNQVINKVKGTSEFAIIKQQVEIYHDSDPQKKHTIDKVLSMQDDWINSGDIVIFRPGLTVGDVRGKVIFWNDDMGKFGQNQGAGSVTDSYILTSDDSFVEYTQQSNYEVHEQNCQGEKLGYIKDHAEKYAGRDLRRERWSVNQTNCYYMEEYVIEAIEGIIEIPTHIFLPHPYEAANRLHPLLLDYLSNELPVKPAGIITMDFTGKSDGGFCGDEIPSAIFLHNFKILGQN